MNEKLLKKNYRARGQVSMPDILFASLLFLLILVGLVNFSNNLQNASQQTLDRKTLDSTTANVAEFIIKNAGEPSNWETLTDTNQITQIGLAQKDRVLRPEKVVAFVNMGNLSYVTARQKLNIPYYEFYATFEGGVNLSTGQSPPVNAPQSVVQRFVTINGRETIFTLTLYAP